MRLVVYDVEVVDENNDDDDEKRPKHIISRHHCEFPSQGILINFPVKNKMLAQRLCVVPAPSRCWPTRKLAAQRRHIDILYNDTWHYIGTY